MKIQVSLLVLIIITFLRVILILSMVELKSCVNECSLLFVLRLPLVCCTNLYHLYQFESAFWGLLLFTKKPNMFMCFQFWCLTVCFILHVHLYDAKGSSIETIDFEVFGKEQWIGQFFRKSILVKAHELNVTGYCMNTINETVAGVLQGPSEAIEKIKLWFLKDAPERKNITNIEYKVDDDDFKYDEFVICI